MSLNFAIVTLRSQRSCKSGSAWSKFNDRNVLIVVLDYFKNQRTDPKIFLQISSTFQISRIGKYGSSDTCTIFVGTFPILRPLLIFSSNRPTFPKSYDRIHQHYDHEILKSINLRLKNKSTTMQIIFRAACDHIQHHDRTIFVPKAYGRQLGDHSPIIVVFWVFFLIFCETLSYILLQREFLLLRSITNTSYKVDVGTFVKPL